MKIIIEFHFSDPKTPKQLFTPSSKSDFINDYQDSPPKSRRHLLPSPVKFQAENEDPEDSSQVSNIIQSLEEDNDYQMLVSDAELERVAQETVQELESLRETNLDLELNEILSKINPPTQDEIKEKRTLQLELDDDDEESNDSSKFFPIFDKNRAISNKEKTPEKKTQNKTKRGLEPGQMIIDAGQKSLTDVQTCVECGFVYNAGNQEDEIEHGKNHVLAKQGVKFPGWKNENVVGEFLDARIIAVKPKDHSSHWAKVTEVLNLVDKQLGIMTEGHSR